MEYIKNIPHEVSINLAGQVEILEGQVVSKTLVQNKSISITLFAFDEGEEISTHESNGDAMVTVLEGKGLFTVDDKEYMLQQGEALIMPANKPHAVLAKEAFKMLLIVVFPSPAE